MHDSDETPEMTNWPEDEADLPDEVLQGMWDEATEVELVPFPGVVSVRYAAVDTWIGRSVLSGLPVGITDRYDLVPSSRPHPLLVGYSGLVDLPQAS